MMTNANNFNDAVDAEDVVVNNLRAIKQIVVAKIDEVRKTEVPAEKAEFKAGYLQAFQDMQTLIKTLNA